MPTLELPPVSPLTSQVTDEFASLTAAVNRAVPPTTTFADFGKMVTVPGALGPLIETVAFAVLLSSALATAVTVTLEGIGTYGGAVYVPVLSMVPTALLPPANPVDHPTDTGHAAVGYRRRESLLRARRDRHRLRRDGGGHSGQRTQTTIRSRARAATA